jgi:GNAT superfamily N-acetyltransferase
MPFHGEPEGRAGLAHAQLRIRQADVEDSAFLAEVMLLASRSHLSRGFWDLVVAEEVLLDFLELLTLIDSASFCHYSNFLLGETEEGPAAALSAYEPGADGMLSPGQLIAAAWEEFGWPDEELLDAYERLEPYQTALPEQRPGLWTIEWVATIPLMRRRGFITALLDRILDEGRTRDYDRAQITTFIGNESAIRGYERLGFQLAEERRHPEFEKVMGAPGLSRFERRL